MAAALKVADDGVYVEGNTSLCDGKGVAVVFKQEPTGGAGGVRHAGRACAARKYDSGIWPAASCGV